MQQVSVLPLGRWMNSVAFALAFSEPSYRRGRMDSILCSSEAAGPRFAACEYGVPLQDADAALAALVAWAEDASCPERFLDGPVDIRFGAPDVCSPALDASRLTPCCCRLPVCAE